MTGAALPDARLTTEAALLGGFVTPAQAVAWADAWIMRLDQLPDALVDLSLSGGRPNEVYTALAMLAPGPFTPEAVRMYCQILLRHLEAKPDDLRPITSALYRLNQDGLLPEEVSAKVYWLDDMLDLTLQGVYATEAQVRQEIMQFLESQGGQQLV